MEVKILGKKHILGRGGDEFITLTTQEDTRTTPEGDTRTTPESDTRVATTFT